MEHSKAELRATRERLGVTQAHLAKVMGVEVRSVKRWESPSAPQQAPADVWAYLGELLRTQDEAVDTALEVAQASPADMVRMPYWASQADYDANHGGPDAGPYRVANATALAVAITLEAHGYGVEWSNANPHFHDMQNSTSHVLHAMLS